MFNVGGGEVLLILIVALLVLGPTKMPEAARQVGQAMSTLRRVSNGFQRELREAMEVPDDDPGPRLPPATPAKPGDAATAAEAEAEPTDGGSSANGADASGAPPSRTASTETERADP